MSVVSGFHVFKPKFAGLQITGLDGASVLSKTISQSFKELEFILDEGLTVTDIV